MGEATYYMKVTFDSQEKAAKAIEGIASFFEEGMKAYNWWQAHRNLPQEEFWKGFGERFPQTSEYLKSFSRKNFGATELEEGAPVFGGDNNNNLAGLLDFGSDDDDWREWCQNTRSAILTYSATVWHFADWQPLANFIAKKFDADHVSWISDEDVSPFELLD